MLTLTLLLFCLASSQESTDLSSGENMALGQEVVQSTTNENYEAHKAIDGYFGIDPDEGQGCAATLIQNYPWWRVDLGGIVSTAVVQLFLPRGITNQQGVQIRVGNRPEGFEFNEVCTSNSEITVSSSYDGQITNCLSSGRYVYVNINRRNVRLSLCEVRVVRKGPQPIENVLATVGQSFDVTLKGISFGVLDRIRVVAGAARCGSEEAFEMHPSVLELTAPYGNRTSGRWDTETWEAVQINEMGVYKVCWCGNLGGNVDEHCETAERFFAHAQTIVVNGIIRTIVGDGFTGDGLDDGRNATDVRLDNPTDVAVGGDYLFIAEGNRVRSLSSLTGLIYTVGTYFLQLDQPEGISASEDGSRLFIADTGNHRVREVYISLATDHIDHPRVSSVFDLVGTGIPGYAGDFDLASLALLNTPKCAYFDEAWLRLWICDSENRAIRVVVLGSGGEIDLQGVTVTQGQIATVMGGNVNQPLGDGYLSPFADMGQVSSIALSRGTVDQDSISTVGVYATDSTAHTVRRNYQLWGNAVGVVGTLLGKSGISGATELYKDPGKILLNSPQGIAVKDSLVFISDSGNNRLLLSPSLEYGPVGCWRESLTNPLVPSIENTGSPWLDGDQPRDRVDAIRKCANAVLDRHLSDVFALRAGGHCAGSTEAAAVFRLNGFSASCVDGRGSLRDNSVYQFLKSGGWPDRSIVNSVWAIAGGDRRPGFTGDLGTAWSAELNEPRGIAIDPSSGNLFLADKGNNRIRLIFSRLGMNKLESTVSCLNGGSCTLSLTGNGLSGDDGVGIFYLDFPCGDSRNSFLPGIFPNPLEDLYSHSYVSRQYRIRDSSVDFSSEYRICYCLGAGYLGQGCERSQDFKFEVGIMRLTGPHFGTVVHGIAGEKFNIVLSGSELSFRNRIIVVEWEHECGEEAAVMVPDWILSSSSSSSLRDVRAYGDASYSIYHDIRIYKAGAFKVCWCAYEVQCTFDQAYTVQAAKILLSGPYPSDQEIKMVVGERGHLTLVGSGFSSYDRVMVIEEEFQCGDAEGFGWSSAFLGSFLPAGPMDGSSQHSQSWSDVVVWDSSKSPKVCWCGSRSRCSEPEDFIVEGGQLVISGAIMFNHILMGFPGQELLLPVTGTDLSRDARVRIVQGSCVSGTPLEEIDPDAGSPPDASFGDSSAQGWQYYTFSIEGVFQACYCPCPVESPSERCACGEKDFVLPLAAIVIGLGVGRRNSLASTLEWPRPEMLVDTSFMGEASPSLSDLPSAEDAYGEWSGMSVDQAIGSIVSIQTGDADYAGSGGPILIKICSEEGSCLDRVFRFLSLEKGNYHAQTGSLVAPFDSWNPRGIAIEAETTDAVYIEYVDVTVGAWLTRRFVIDGWIGLSPERGSTIGPMVSHRFFLLESCPRCPAGTKCRNVLRSLGEQRVARYLELGNVEWYAECVPICGDGHVTGNEQCDDGNQIALDGCSAMCFVEDSFHCHIEEKGGASVCTIGGCQKPNPLVDKGYECNAQADVQAPYGQELLCVQRDILTDFQCPAGDSPLFTPSRSFCDSYEMVSFPIQFACSSEGWVVDGAYSEDNCNVACLSDFACFSSSFASVSQTCRHHPELDCNERDWDGVWQGFTKQPKRNADVMTCSLISKRLPVKGEFWYDFASIVLQMDQSTSSPAGSFDCSSIIDVVELGVGYNCFNVLQGRYALVQLGRNATVGPPPALLGIVGEGEDEGLSVTVGVSLVNAASFHYPVPPIAIIEAPPTISSCSTWRASALSSLHLGGRAAKSVTWSCKSVYPTTDLCLTVEELIISKPWCLEDLYYSSSSAGPATIKAVRVCDMILEIPASSMITQRFQPSIGEKLTISVEIETFGGLKSSAETEVLFIDQAILPTAWRVSPLQVEIDPQDPDGVMHFEIGTKSPLTDCVYKYETTPASLRDGPPPSADESMKISWFYGRAKFYANEVSYQLFELEEASALTVSKRASELRAFVKDLPLKVREPGSKWVVVARALYESQTDGQAVEIPFVLDVKSLTGPYVRLRGPRKVSRNCKLILDGSETSARPSQFCTEQANIERDRKLQDLLGPSNALRGNTFSTAGERNLQDAATSAPTSEAPTFVLTTSAPSVNISEYLAASSTNPFAFEPGSPAPCSSGSLSYRWTCRKFFDGPDDTFGVEDDTPILLIGYCAQANTSRFEIAGSDIPPGWYEFTLHVQDSDVLAGGDNPEPVLGSYSTVVHLAEEDRAPNLIVGESYYSPREKMAFSSVWVYSQPGENFECGPGYVNPSVQLIDATSGLPVEGVELEVVMHELENHRNYTVALDANALELGVMYCFLWDGNLKTAEFSIPQAPIQGWMTITPSLGLSIQTIFTLEQGWTSQLPPIHYAFWYRIKSQSRWQLLRSAGPNRELSTPLPAGNYDIRGEAIDSLGNSAFTFGEVEVTEVWNEATASALRILYDFVIMSAYSMQTIVSMNSPETAVLLLERVAIDLPDLADFDFSLRAVSESPDLPVNAEVLIEAVEQFAIQLLKSLELSASQLPNSVFSTDKLRVLSEFKSSRRLQVTYSETGEQLVDTPVGTLVIGKSQFTSAVYAVYTLFEKVKSILSVDLVLGAATAFEALVARNADAEGDLRVFDKEVNLMLYLVSRTFLSHISLSTRSQASVDPNALLSWSLLNIGTLVSMGLLSTESSLFSVGTSELYVSALRVPTENVSSFGFQLSPSSSRANRWPFPDLDVPPLGSIESWEFQFYEPSYNFSLQTPTCRSVDGEYQQYLDFFSVSWPSNLLLYSENVDITRVYTFGFRSCNLIQKFSEAAGELKIMFRITEDTVKNTRYGYGSVLPFTCIWFDPSLEAEVSFGVWRSDRCRTIYSRAQEDIVTCYCSVFGVTMGLRLEPVPTYEYVPPEIKDPHIHNIVTYTVILLTVFFLSLHYIAGKSGKAFATAENELADIFLGQASKQLQLLLRLRRRPPKHWHFDQLKKASEWNTCENLMWWLEQLAAYFGELQRRAQIGYLTIQGDPFFQSLEVAELKAMRDGTRVQLINDFHRKTDGRVHANVVKTNWEVIDEDQKEELLAVKDDILERRMRIQQAARKAAMMKKVVTAFASKKSKKLLSSAEMPALPQRDTSEKESLRSMKSEPLMLANTAYVDDLPAGWIRKETETADVFYVNTETGKTQFEKPRVPPPIESPVSQGDAKDDWQKVTAEDGKTFYVNPDTFERSWTKPLVGKAQKSRGLLYERNIAGETPKAPPATSTLSPKARRSPAAKLEKMEAEPKHQKPPPDMTKDELWGSHGILERSQSHSSLNPPVISREAKHGAQAESDGGDKDPDLSDVDIEKSSPGKSRQSADIDEEDSPVSSLNDEDLADILSEDDEKQAGEDEDDELALTEEIEKMEAILAKEEEMDYDHPLTKLGWVSKYSASQKMKYYYHLTTGVSVWRMPILPQGWRAQRLKKEDPVYYLNSVTNKVQWEWPTQHAAKDQHLAPTLGAKLKYKVAKGELPDPYADLSSSEEDIPEADPRHPGYKKFLKRKKKIMERRIEKQRKRDALKEKEERAVAARPVGDVRRKLFKKTKGPLNELFQPSPTAKSSTPNPQLEGRNSSFSSVSPPQAPVPPEEPLSDPERERARKRVEETLEMQVALLPGAASDPNDYRPETQSLALALAVQQSGYAGSVLSTARENNNMTRSEVAESLIPGGVVGGWGVPRVRNVERKDACNEKEFVAQQQADDRRFQSAKMFKSIREFTKAEDEKDKSWGKLVRLQAERGLLEVGSGFRGLIGCLTQAERHMGGKGRKDGMELLTGYDEDFAGQFLEEVMMDSDLGSPTNMVTSPLRKGQHKSRFFNLEEGGAVAVPMKKKGFAGLVEKFSDMVEGGWKKLR